MFSPAQGGWEDGSLLGRKVSMGSLARPRNPFETLPNSPTGTPNRSRSNSYKNLGSPSPGNLSPIYEGRQKQFISAPRPAPESLITCATPDPDELCQVPRDIPKRKHTSESPESPGGDVFHFSPEEDSCNSLITNDPINIKGSKLNESSSMQREQQLDKFTESHKDSEIPASAWDGFESHCSPNLNTPEVPRPSLPRPLTGCGKLITHSCRKNRELGNRQPCSTPDSNSSSGQDLAWSTVPSGSHSIFGPSPEPPGSSTPLGRDNGEKVKSPNSPRRGALVKLYAHMELDDTTHEQEAFAVCPTPKQDLSLRSSMNGGNTSVSNRTSVKICHHLQPREPDRPSTSIEFQASPNTKRPISPRNNKIVVGEFVPNFVDKTEKHANLRSEMERILNEPDNPRIRGSPLVSGADTRVENSTLTASLSLASSDALQEILDFLTAQVKALLKRKSYRENPWSKHFPVTNAGSIQYMPKGTRSYAFEDCSNLQKLIECTAVFLDTLTGTSNTGFWVEPDLFVTSLCFRERSLSGHMVNCDPGMALENWRYFVSPSNTGMLEDRVPVLLKAWDTPANLAIFQLVSSGISQQYHHEHIGIENLVEGHELLPTYSSQICSDDNIAAVGYIHARPKPQERIASYDLRRSTSYVGFNSSKDTRIRTVCSINRVRQIIEGSEHTSDVLKVNCLFPQNFYGSPCIIKGSGSVIGVVNGPHSESNTGDIKVFPKGFKNKLRWFAL
ncbi:hypothetical protein HOY80DRAFT_553275 [Tuber brumale]|nr:hypothetical protein HOY80DRAFT_553275 [Tuber brumale]